MGFFDNFSRSVQATSQNALKRTKEMADIAKLNSQVAETNNHINQLYLEMGEKYYQLHAHNAEPQMEKYITAISDMKKQIAQWEDLIQDLRGLTKCPNCGKIIPKNVVFCSGCGYRTLPDNLTVCPGCGKVVEKGTMFCSSCGTRIPEETPSTPVTPKPILKCVQCGALLDEGAVFCSCCGHEVKAPLVEESQSEPVVECKSTTETDDYVTIQEESVDNMDDNSVQDSVGEPVDLPVCPNCGVTLEPNQMFCNNCGTPVGGTSSTVSASESEPDTCPKCGAPLDPGTLFCPNCGNPIG